MKIAWRALAVGLIVVIALAGCETTQPDRIGTRESSVSFSATANVGLYNCYDLYQDTNQDGTPDFFLQFLCEPVIEITSTGDLVHTLAVRSVPWRYSVKFTVLRAGATSEQLLTSLSGVVGSSVQPFDPVDDFISLTGYDTIVVPVPDKNQGDLYWINGRQVSAGSPLYMSSIFVDPGEPNLLGPPATTFDFNLDTGDTVIGRARKQAFSAAPPYIFTLDPNIQLSGRLSVGGVDVHPESTPPVAAGTTSPTTSGQDEAGVTFSFTVR